MFSLQKALGQDDRFFELLEASATEARASAQALRRFFQTTDQSRSLRPGQPRYSSPSTLLQRS